MNTPIYLSRSGMLTKEAAGWRIAAGFGAPKYSIRAYQSILCQQRMWTLRRGDLVLCRGTFEECTSILRVELSVYSLAISDHLVQFDSIGRQLAVLGFLDQYSELYLAALCCCIDLMIYGKRKGRPNVRLGN